MNDLQLVTMIFGAIAVLVLGAWLWHNRAARGNAQIAKYHAEARLEQEDRSSWREALLSLRSDLDGRMRTIEETIRHVPSSTDFAELEGTVRTVQAEQRAVAEGQGQIRASLNRIEDYLLRGKRS